MVLSYKPSPDVCIEGISAFMQNPGPEHIAAAHHVLRYILGTYQASGVTYHRNPAVLNQSYPHRHVMVAASDSGFSHVGGFAISGFVVLMNGGPIMWRSKAQSTPSNDSTEAEVKALTLCVEACNYLLNLWAEIARVEHGIVRILVDSEGTISQAVRGPDHRRSTPYKRCQFFVEDVAARDVVWYDSVPGAHNPADMFTKQVRNHGEFEYKVAMANGSKPQLYETAAVIHIKANISKTAGSM